MSYYTFWGMQREPFGTTPDPDMFYKTLGHEDCYERLKLAVLLRRGLSVVLGDVGFGKTTIKVAFLQELQAQPDFDIAVVNNPKECRTDIQFLRMVLQEFGLPFSARTGLELTSQFLSFLQDGYTRGRNVLLVIDEGQNLLSSHLETLRTWLGFETPKDKLINIAIFAQNELEERIRSKRNLAQRVAMAHRLNPLNRNDTAGMIDHRLAVAGLPPGERVFEETAIDAIFEASQGVPRVITTLCGDSLTEAVFRRERCVTRTLAEEVVGKRLFVGV